MKNILTDEKLVRDIEWANGLLLVAAILGAWIFFSGKAALGVLFGSAIATSSFQILKWQLRRAFRTPGITPRAGGLFASYYLRFLAVVFVIFSVIYYGWANPIALLVGLSTIPLSMVVVGVKEFLVMVVNKGGR